VFQTCAKTPRRGQKAAQANWAWLGGTVTMSALCCPTGMRTQLLLLLFPACPPLEAHVSPNTPSAAASYPTCRLAWVTAVDPPVNAGLNA
jgi:hypothetical protein